MYKSKVLCEPVFICFMVQWENKSAILREAVLRLVTSLKKPHRELEIILKTENTIRFMAFLV